MRFTGDVHERKELEFKSRLDKLAGWKKVIHLLHMDGKS